MYLSKYLIITIAAITLAACEQKPISPDNMDALKSADTRLIMKTEEAGTIKDKAIPAEQLIIPGKSIGKLRLNANMNSVYQILGRPDSINAAMGSALAVWYAGHNRSGYKTSVFSRHNYNGKEDTIQYIRKILVTSPYFKTTEGLGNGMLINKIKKHYILKKSAGYKDKGKQIEIYNDVKRGVSFETDSADSKCIAISIYKPNKAGDAYLNMH